MVQNVTTPLLHVYQWLISSETAAKLFETIKGKMPPQARLMSAPNSHCTAHVTAEQDDHYEEKFFADINDSVQLTDVFWGPMHSAAAVPLTLRQSQFFTIANSTPHVSLSKAPEDRWKDLGPFTKSCLEAKDWQATDVEPVLFSLSLNVHRRPLLLHTHALRTFHLVHDDDCDSPDTYTCYTDTSQLPPELQAIPSSLWVGHKYDVGLIKGAEPIKITPKSDFRPNLPQYPLKPEAIASITPVFNSLLDAGVIVPCPDSLVRMPMLSVKKVRPPPQQDGWRFVQDLRAVNTAVHACAPNVPNCHTILSQIPADASWFTVVDLSNAFFFHPS